MKKKVLLGMSGGVDSSVSAVLLQKQGYEVIGCTMELWKTKEETGYCGSQAIYDAKRVCKQLGIQHYTINCQEEFKNKVVNTFIKEYQEVKTPNPCIECNKYLKFGTFYKVVNTFIKEYQEVKTPNPCIECNKYLKFGTFYKKAKELACEYIATGHYARIAYSNKYEQYVLKKAREEKKDQSYFLYTISKEILKHIIFPLQDYENKEEIRKIAQENKLFVAQKKDSQEICFIPHNNYQDFLKTYGNYKEKNGNIVLKNGEILGRHSGLAYYTIGQRKGLGISYQEPLYVVRFDKQKNEVIVGPEKELYRKELYAEEINWMLGIPLQEKIRCKAKIRYRAKEADATIEMDGNRIKVILDSEQRAITSGQSVVFYDEEGIVLGGGKIV